MSLQGKTLFVTGASRCIDEDLARLEWAVLDWNQPAIVFHNGLGATSKTEWITRQLTGEALRQLAGVSLLARGAGSRTRSQEDVDV